MFKGYTLLMYAARYGYLDIVKFLLNQGADINDMDDDGKFLIFYFIGYRQFVAYL